MAGFNGMKPHAPDKTPIVAVVDDNPDILEDVVFHLERAGFVVRACRDGAELDRCFAEPAGERPAVLVLDIGLPGEDGLKIAARMRKEHDGLGIVMLTARGHVDDRIAGHYAGADNYLSKPVDMKELVAVVAARVRALPPVQDADHPAAWRLLTRDWRLVAPTGPSVSLTGSEWRVMQTLALAPDHQVGRDALIEALGQPLEEYGDRRLETLMSRLRRKFKTVDETEGLLRSVRSQGYRFSAPLLME